MCEEPSEAAVTEEPGDAHVDPKVEAVWAALAVAGAWLVVAPVLVAMPMAHDVATSDWWVVFAGYADAIGQHARALELPRLLVGPHLGTNLAGQIEAGPFYLPGWLLFAALGPLAGLAALYAFHVALGAVGAFVLGRASGCGPGPSALMGIAYGASGFVVAHVKHPNIVGSSAWLPWALAAVLLARTGPWPALPLLALACAAPWFPAHPQIAFYATAVTFGFAVAVHRKDLRTLVASVAAMATGGLLAALSVLPTVALARESFRSTPEWSFATRFSMDPADLVYFVAPALRGCPYTGTWRPWFRDDALAWEDYAYVGLPTLLLAIVAATRDSGSRRVAVAAGVATLFALGPATPLYGLAWSLVPALDAFRFPQRALWLVGLALAWLAARGLEALSSDRRIHGLAVGALVVDLTFAHWTWLPTVPTAAAHPSALVERARQGAPDARVYVVGAVQAWRAAYEAMAGSAPFEPLIRLPSGNLAGVYGVESPDGYVALQPEATAWFWAPGNRDRMVGAPELPYIDEAGRLVGARRLERAAVTYVIAASPIVGLTTVDTSDGFQLLALAHPWPAVYTVAGWSGGEAALARALAETSDAVVLEAEPRTGDPTPVPIGAAALGVQERYDVTGRNGALVVARAWDVGWTAEIDGASVPVVRANGWQRAVVLPDGARTVAFAYDPPGLTAGAGLAGLGILALGALTAGSLRRGGRWTSS